MKIAVYTTSDDGYASKAIVSLLSAASRIDNYDTDLFIIGKRFSKETKKLLERNSIKVVEMNLDSIFHTAWEYPIECFYIFAGPEHFAKMDYTHSLYVDGDTLCINNPFKLLRVEEVSTFAGHANGRISEILNKDFEPLKSLYDISSKSDEAMRIQTGVIVFNNAHAADALFLQTIGTLYEDAIKNGYPRKGDDSLFALYQLLDDDRDSYVYLSSSYNYIESQKSRLTKLLQVTGLLYIKFYHFTGDSMKPWDLSFRQCSLLNAIMRSRWQHYKKELVK